MGNRQLLASYSAGTGLLDHSQDRLFVTGNYGLDWAVQIGDSHVTGRTRSHHFLARSASHPRVAIAPG